MSIANDEQELRAALEAAAREGSRILIEQYIRGREVPVRVVRFPFVRDGQAQPGVLE